MFKKLMEKFIFYKKAFIYRIYDPRGISSSFYIGKTSRALQKRLREHIKDRNYKDKSKLPISCFINYLFENNESPTIEAIEEYNNISLFDLNTREKYFILFFRANNYKILNVADGGEGRSNYTASNETKQKMSDSHKNRKRSENEIMNAILLGKSWLGKKRGPDEWTKERREKNSIRCSGENNPRAKLTIEKVMEIKQQLCDGVSQHAIALMFNISRSVVANIKSGNIWRNVG